MKIMLSVVNYGHGTHLIQKKCERVGLYKKRTGCSFGGCEAGGDSRGDGDEKTSPAH